MRLVLRANALFDVAVGLVLGAATWDALYELIGAHCGAFAIAEGMIASRSVAMLLPPD
jgi:hypothetical protein